MKCRRAGRTLGSCRFLKISEPNPEGTVAADQNRSGVRTGVPGVISLSCFQLCLSKLGCAIVFNCFRHSSTVEATRQPHLSLTAALHSINASTASPSFDSIRFRYPASASRHRRSSRSVDIVHGVCLAMTAMRSPGRVRLQRRVTAMRRVTVSFLGRRQRPIAPFVAMPGAPFVASCSFLLLVVRPGAPSSFLLL